MRYNPIPQEWKSNINALRLLIEGDQTDHLRVNNLGWQYGGKTFNDAVNLLKDDMKKDLQGQGIDVAGCTVRHFYRGANITPHDPTKRLLIIPINGVSTLSPPGPPSGELPLDTYCLIDDQPTLSGRNIDVIFVAFDARKENP
ncbi:uncharacterized protein N7483_002473 [Penicillium malachiteum]|uniref:uncharacterized protein n=1 Tax=Penicillium malachiteum TaxID=1324776 RepID=UPI00254877E8|nr:uncharacterized protein N7483_002473 [Penicillium malachiteum]KAJ5737348.1 hypothetical protein N7483_002473 [Penicillium malachiteum]